jgi:hypothetical protein
MRTSRTTQTVVEHVIETDASGTQRIGARRVVDDGEPPESDPIDESARESRERTRLSGR